MTPLLYRETWRMTCMFPFVACTSILILGTCIIGLLNPPRFHSAVTNIWNSMRAECCDIRKYCFSLQIFFPLPAGTAPMGNNPIGYKIALLMLPIYREKSHRIKTRYHLGITRYDLFCKKRWLGRIDTWKGLRQICKCLGGAVNRHRFRFVIRPG